MVLSMPSNLYKTYLREYFPKKPAHGSTFSTRPNVYGISANLTTFENWETILLYLYFKIMSFNRMLTTTKFGFK